MRVLSSGHSEGCLSCDAQAVCDIDTYVHTYVGHVMFCIRTLRMSDIM